MFSYRYGRDLWGPTSKYTMFNGVGDNGPRICPGRNLGIDLAVTAVKSLFKTPLKQPKDARGCCKIIGAKIRQDGHPYDNKVSLAGLEWRIVSVGISKMKPSEPMSASIIKYFPPKFIVRPTFKMAGYTFFKMGTFYSITYLYVIIIIFTYIFIY